MIEVVSIVEIRVIARGGISQVDSWILRCQLITTAVFVSLIDKTTHALWQALLTLFSLGEQGLTALFSSRRRRAPLNVTARRQLLHDLLLFLHTKNTIRSHLSASLLVLLLEQVDLLANVEVVRGAWACHNLICLLSTNT